MLASLGGLTILVKTRHKTRRERLAADLKRIESSTAETELPNHRGQRLKESAQADRAALIAKLEQWGETKFATVLRNCGTPIPLTCTGCGTPKLGEKSCRKRWCPVCARQLSARKLNQYEGMVSRMKWPLALTLTITNDDDILVVLKRLKKAIKQFRTGTWWNRCRVTGGIISIEITDADSPEACRKRGGPRTGGRWHPHAHLIIDCEWLAVNAAKPQRGATKEEWARQCKAAKWELTEAWKAFVQRASDGVTADDAITYVARANEGTLKEALKYSVKPADLLAMKSNPAEVIRAMLGNRLVTPFGSCHGIRAELKKEEQEGRPLCECENCKASSWIPTIAVTRWTWNQPTIYHGEFGTMNDVKQRNRATAARDKAEKAARPAKTERAKYRAALSQSVGA